MISANVLIIGAGPVGLFQAFYLGLQGITNVHIVDTLPYAGGQCAELYPTKPIYDIPAIPEITGGQLTAAQLQQLQPFPPTFHFNQQVTELQTLHDPERKDDADERLSYLVRTAEGLEFDAKTVVLACGMGSFVPNKLTLPGFADLEDRIAYKVTEPEQYRGKNIAILGGGDSALDWTLELQPVAESLILIHRSAEYRAHKATVAKVKALHDDALVDLLTGQIVGVEAHGDGVKLLVKEFSGLTRSILLDNLLCFYGLSPKLGPVANWGLELDKNRVKVDMSTFETSLPGVYAVGDCCYYPGKVKLILSGYHEAALATYKIAEYVNDGKKLLFTYTTTSTIIHKRLGKTQPFFLPEECSLY